MKAKDLAKQYLESEESKEYGLKMQTLWDILRTLTLEMRDIGFARHITNDNAFVAIVKEQNQKWQAFCRVVLASDAEFAGTNMNGFYDYIAYQMPELWAVLQYKL